MKFAAFVHGTKGDKYSALLPLLGLDELVNAAENLRQLAKSIETNSKIKETKAVLKIADTKRKKSSIQQMMTKSLKKLRNFTHNIALIKAKR